VSRHAAPAVEPILPPHLTLVQLNGYLAALAADKTPEIGQARRELWSSLFGPSKGRHAAPRDPKWWIVEECDALAAWLSRVVGALGMTLAYTNRDHLLDALGCAE